MTPAPPRSSNVLVGGASAANARSSSTLLLVAALAILATPWGGLGAQDLPDEIERTDLLTFAQGALFLSQEGLASGSAGNALRVIDGNPRRLGLTSDGRGPVEFLYQLPTPTTFDRFAIPGVVERPGNVTFIRHVTIHGSAEGPASDFAELARFELEVHDEPDQVTEILLENAPAIRWIKVRFEGGILIEEGHEGRTNLEFTELIGNGTQEPMELSDAFDGLRELRLIERTDLQGRPFLLEQVGSAVSGCYGDWSVQGTVNGHIAKMTGIDSRERPVALIVVADENGVLRAGVSENNSIFGARITVDVPNLEAPTCARPPKETRACGTHVYVNFDVNSATIRPESEQVLADTFRKLREEQAAKVVIVGHTSTEGAKDYNQGLSERRAAAVASDLVARGYDPSVLSSEGRGEDEPLIRPDSSETQRELNRRVEIRCEASG